MIFRGLGNNWSYKYARRQWCLVDNPDLKFKYLAAFDQAMVQVIRENKVLSAPAAWQTNMDTVNKVIIFDRGNLVFVFNFSPTNSIPDYEFWVPEAG